MSKTLFVTGKLAREALQNILKKIELPFSYDVAVLPISVAALMNVTWVASKLTDLKGADTVILPGLCQGDEELLSKALGVKVIKGPKDLKDLPGFFGLAAHQTRVGPNV